RIATRVALTRRTRRRILTLAGGQPCSAGSRSATVHSCPACSPASPWPSSPAPGSRSPSPAAWNVILRAAHGDQFFTDAPVLKRNTMIGPGARRLPAVALVEQPAEHGDDVVELAVRRGQRRLVPVELLVVLRLGDRQGLDGVLLCAQGLRHVGQIAVAAGAQPGLHAQPFLDRGDAPLQLFQAAHTVILCLGYVTYGGRARRPYGVSMGASLASSALTSARSKAS